jgi:hypothetical protein
MFNDSRIRGFKRNQKRSKFKVQGFKCSIIQRLEGSRIRGVEGSREVKSVQSSKFNVQKTRGARIKKVQKFKGSNVQ